MLQDRGELPKEEGDVIGECKAMHGENFLSSWLWGHGKEKMVKTRRREEEKEENETGNVERRYVGHFSVEPFDTLSQGRDLESCGCPSWRDILEKPDDLSDCEPETRVDVSAMPGVTCVLVSLSSVVTEFCDGFSFCSDWEFVEQQSFSFSQKQAVCCTGTQEEMRCEGPQVKAKKNDAAHTTAKFVFIV